MHAYTSMYICPPSPTPSEVRSSHNYQLRLSDTIACFSCINTRTCTRHHNQHPPHCSMHRSAPKPAQLVTSTLTQPHTQHHPQAFSRAQHIAFSTPVAKQDLRALEQSPAQWPRRLQTKTHRYVNLHSSVCQPVGAHRRKKIVISRHSQDCAQVPSALKHRRSFLAKMQPPSVAQHRAQSVQCKEHERIPVCVLWR